MSRLTSPKGRKSDEDWMPDYKTSFNLPKNNEDSNPDILSVNAQISLKKLWFTKLLRFQNQQCGICGILFDVVQLRFDHDHNTGLPRGLLCVHCNANLRYDKINSQHNGNKLRMRHTQHPHRQLFRANYLEYLINSPYSKMMNII